MDSSIQLDDALQDRVLVRFSRRFEDSDIRGYVLDVGEPFFLLALVNDRIWFDGFECFRRSDVSDLQIDKFRAFVETALTLREQFVPAKPQVSLTTIEELLVSAGREFPLVTIHREEVDPDVCHIGRVVEVENGQVLLLEINPDAIWEAEPTAYCVSEITRVNFGGDYEDALYLVGGEPGTE